MTIKVTYNVTDVYMSQSVSPVYINVSYSDGGASGGGVWGSITGTLSNQTDLQTALDAKLDESTIDGGAEGQILSKASATDFDFAWINNYAKYLATNVRNQTGSTIAAFQVVYISGATGNKPLISLADADTEATSSKTYGVTATSIANNGTGDVVTAGELSGINTSAFNEGDLLWLSTTAGGVVTTPPAEPAHAVFIGYVVRSHPTLGVIDVSIQNGYELNELHGVQITTPTDNQGLFYNSTSTLWENKSITTALGYTPVPTTRNITINGVTYDLSADRTWTIATGISGSGAVGQVTYWTGASAVSGSNNLFWDNANGRLGIGTNSPTSALHVTSTTWNSTQPFISFINLDPQGAESKGLFVQAGALSASSYIANFANYSGTSFFYLDGTGNLGINNTSPSYRLDVNGVVRFQNVVRFANNLWMVSDEGSNRLQFATSSSSIYGSPVGHIWRTASDVTIMSLFSNGNLALGQTSDSGQRLQVVGDTLLRGSGATSATTALTVQNSSSTNLLNILNNGNVGIGTNAPSTVLHVVGSVILNGASITIQNSSPSGDVTFGNNAYIRMGSTRFRAVGASFQFQDNSYNDKVVINTTTGSITSAQYRLSALNTAPATSSSVGTLGEIVIDANHIYVCTATNTWKRVAIATF